jgi:cysteinyl-tRNA synthetase
MATKYLGSEFDIHGGGLDLVFPHHENEIAQSVCAGDGFARYWLHNGLVNTEGEKMSKSLGNSLVVADVLREVRPQTLRYYLGAPHYRSGMDYTMDGLAEAAAAYLRIETFVRNALDALDGGVDAVPDEATWAAFAGAMDDDLAVPRALGLLHDAVRDGNAALTAGEPSRLAGTLGAVRLMLSVLALDPVSQWPAAGAGGRLSAVVDELVGAVLAAREAARDRRDFAEADRMRDALQRAGVVVEDTARGPRWRIADRSG